MESTINDSSDRDASPAEELGQYRSFLRVQAMGLARQYRGKLEPSDMVQQTLLEAHKKIDQFRGQTKGEMAKWLNQMLAYNIADAVRAMRRQKRDIAREKSLEEAGSNSMSRAADWIAAEQTSPSLRVDKAEQILQLADAISQLPPLQQEVIVLHHLQGQSLAEVATQLKRSRSAIAGLLYRGLKSLRSMLAN